jgi:PAS domain S-box-containing protein
MSDGPEPVPVDLSKLKGLLDNLPGMVYRCADEPGRPMHFVSEGSVQLTGYEPAELGPGGTATWDELIVPEERSAAWKEIRDAVARREPFDLGYRIRDRAGHVKWVAERGRAVFSDAGELLCLEGFIVDATRSRTADEALRAGEERFRKVFEDAPIGVALTAVDGTLSRVNRAFAELLGYSTEELARLPWRQITHPDDVAESEELVRALLAGEVSTRRIEKRYLARDGRVVWTVLHSTLLRDAEGSPRHFVTQVLDVSDRKQAEQALREASDALERRVAERTAELTRSNQLLDETSRLARVGGWELDLATNAVTWTQMVREIHEVEPGFVPDLDAAVHFYAAEAVPVISDAVRRSIEQQQPFDIELPLVTAKGTRRWVRAIGRPHVDDGKVVRLGGVFQDLTSRKVVDDELARYRTHLEELVAERTAELARSNAELEQFAYVASHDLQEPLRTVASYVQLLARRYRGRLDPDADDFIGFATEGAERMQRLIEDLLAYSRVGTKGRAFAPVDSAEALRTALRSLAESVRESGAVITHDPLPRVVADGSQLAQLLQNLVGNALKFHGPDPPRVHVSARRDGGEWRFSVKDQGIGVAPEHFERIFRVFQRLNSREEYPGTGIGLAICKKIVERHLGRIGVDSEAGRGATFWFTLPVREEES